MSSVTFVIDKADAWRIPPNSDHFINVTQEGDPGIRIERVFGGVLCWNQPPPHDWDWLGDTLPPGAEVRP